MTQLLTFVNCVLNDVLEIFYVHKLRVTLEQFNGI